MSDNVCVPVRDRLAAKRLLQMEVQASKQHKPADILGSVYLRHLPGSDGFLKLRYAVASGSVRWAVMSHKQPFWGSLSLQGIVSLC